MPENSYTNKLIGPPTLSGIMILMSPERSGTGGIEHNTPPTTTAALPSLSTTTTTTTMAVTHYGTGEQGGLVTTPPTRCPLLCQRGFCLSVKWVEETEPPTEQTAETGEGVNWIAADVSVFPPLFSLYSHPGCNSMWIFC